MILSVLFSSSLTVKELFNTSDLRLVSEALDYSEVKKNSFSFLGVENFDIEVIMHTISKEFVDVVIEKKMESKERRYL
jgi:hypothetical protein